MTCFSAILKTGGAALLLLLSIALLDAQTFDKQHVRQMLETAFRNKVKHSSTEIHRGLELLQQAPSPASATPATPTPSRLSARSANRAISASSESESEVHAAINPTDSNNIIAAAMRLDTDNLLAALTFPIYYTRDFGQTWQLSTFNGVNDQSGFSLVLGGGDPMLVFDDQGVAYFSWLTITVGLDFVFKGQLHWAVSTDGGATWQRQPSLIDDGILGDVEGSSGALPDKQWMTADMHSAAHRGNVYVAYAFLNLNDTTFQIRLKTKARTANTFGAAAIVSPPDLRFVQYTSVDVDAAGAVHVLFCGATETDEVLGLYHSKSTDGGASFSEPVRIAPVHLQCFPPGSDPECGIIGIDPNRVYPCPHLRADKSGGDYNNNLYVVWTADGLNNQLSNGLDIYYSRSTDGGATWSAAIVLNDNNDNDTHQFFPSLAVNDAGIVVTTWYDRRGDVNNRMTNYYMTLSRDGGLTFEPNVAISTQSSDFGVIGQSNGNFGVGEYTQVVATSGYALPFWADGRSNDGNIDVFTSQIPLNAGLSTSLPEVRSLAGQFEIVGLFPNPVQDIATLDLQLRKAGPLQVKLFSSDGKVQRVYPGWNLAAGEHRLKLDMRGLAAGTYWVMLRTNEEVKTRGVIVE
ncbi:MAG TPA: T9SS type A sorting domain-containing protein [Saprospiraceae bacterium]|nr:T9SS type A sorting domain-containing protein [Saprospiraceae bacterium]HMP24079.1 T9SS type A sorting domain-containing protein [Saprospiraceae bacterium]